jgi:hypothetical protein
MLTLGRVSFWALKAAVDNIARNTASNFQHVNLGTSLRETAETQACYSRPKEPN